ncbi:6376_t:CDS:1, partial [Scutellospora calospora]
VANGSNFNTQGSKIEAFKPIILDEFYNSLIDKKIAAQALSNSLEQFTDNKYSIELESSNS